MTGPGGFRGSGESREQTLANGTAFQRMIPYFYFNIFFSSPENPPGSSCVEHFRTYR